jgi:hypothetical protein
MLGRFFMMTNESSDRSGNKSFKEVGIQNLLTQKRNNYKDFAMPPPPQEKKTWIDQSYRKGHQNLSTLFNATLLENMVMR